MRNTCNFREELEKQQAKERYQKMHLAGKTDEARADLARLALIRKQREDAAKKRDEEKKGWFVYYKFYILMLLNVDFSKQKLSVFCCSWLFHQLYATLITGIFADYFIKSWLKTYNKRVGLSWQHFCIE